VAGAEGGGAGAVAEEEAAGGCPAGVGEGADGSCAAEGAGGLEQDASAQLQVLRRSSDRRTEAERSDDGGIRKAVNEVARKLKRRATDYTIKNGALHFFTVEDCNTLVANNVSCFTNNPSSPYGLVAVPPPAGKTEDFSLCNSTSMPLCLDVNGVKMSLPWHLDAGEAIVVLGIMPPEVAYLGFVNYIYERSYPPFFSIDYQADTPAPPCWPQLTGPFSSLRRCALFASMDDSLNIASIQVNATPSAGIFSQPVAVVISAAESAAREAARLLKVSGMPTVNIAPFPGQALNLGFGSQADTLGSIFRTAFPTDQKAYSAWIKESPFHVLRLTPKPKVPAPQLYRRPWPCPLFKPEGLYCVASRSPINEAARVTAQGVLTTMGQLEAARDYILKAAAAGRMPWQQSTSGFTGSTPTTGFPCLDQARKCNGNSPDAFIPVSRDLISNAIIPGAIISTIGQLMGYPGLNITEMQNFTIRARRSLLDDSPDSFMIVAGVNHNATNMARYASVAVNNLVVLQGIFAVGNLQMEGSADTFLKGSPYERLSPFMYALEFTRGFCKKRPAKRRKYCFDVPSKGELSIPLSDPLIFMERAFVDPLTGTGPPPEGTVAPEVLHVAKVIPP